MSTNSVHHMKEAHLLVIMDQGRISQAGPYLEIIEKVGQIKLLKVETSAEEEDRQCDEQMLDLKENVDKRDAIEDEILTLHWMGRTFLSYCLGASKKTTVAWLGLMIIFGTCYELGVQIYLLEWLNYITRHGLGALMPFACGTSHSRMPRCNG